MSRGRPYLSKPSLAQHFEAPEYHRGTFGWVCGYSADIDFLNLAAERFTRQTQPQRARAGSISLALMLDPGNPAIALTDTPGVAHLPLASLAAKDFALMHAKVALLGFCHEDDVRCWRVRLLVSTGNWTRQTMEDSLDLAWCIEIASGEMERADNNGEGGNDLRQRCVDVAAARDLLVWLATRFDTRLLGAGQQTLPSETAIARQRLDDWLDCCATQADDTPSRFFDSRTTSLLAQLTSKVLCDGVKRARNLLAMGSGFYESAMEDGREGQDSMPADAGDRPTLKVLASIVDVLQKASVLTTTKPCLDVFVNPNACQAVAHAAPALRRAGYTVRAAGQPTALFGAEAQRALHAKFIFSAWWRKDSNRCHDAWLYLGSGNLTSPGFLNAASAGGNLEAGVVFAPAPLYWSDEPGEQPGHAVGDLLPVQWNSELTPSEPLGEGGDMPERPEPYLAAPLAWLSWREIDAPDGSGVLACDHASKPFELLNPLGEPCASNAEGFLWYGTPPRQVIVRWQDAGQRLTAAVPVVDCFGRIGATALPRLELNEAWWQLANFPMPPDDDAGDDGDALAGPGGRVRLTGAQGGVGTYPVREMMELIEQLAARQTSVDMSDWTAWCCRLRQTLMLAAGSEGVRAFQALGLNPLSPLTAAPFRPDFAENSTTPAGQCYEAVLDEVARAWQVDQLAAIGTTSGAGQ